MTEYDENWQVYSPDRLTRILAKQLKLQRTHNTDPAELPDELRADWIAHMILAATAELHEALNEIGWKKWASSRHVNEEACFGELRDAWQFLTNAMFTVHQVSPDELAELLEDALDAKLTKNYARIENGYTGLDKCPGCKRALDEVKLTVNIRRDGSPELVSCACGAFVDVRIATPYLID
jgi:dUTPase